MAWNSTDTYQVWDVASGCGLASVDAAKNSCGEDGTKYDHSNFNVFGCWCTRFRCAVRGVCGSVGTRDAAGRVRKCVKHVYPVDHHGQFPAQALFNKQVDNTVPGTHEYGRRFVAAVVGCRAVMKFLAPSIGADHRAFAGVLLGLFVLNLIKFWRFLK